MHKLLAGAAALAIVAVAAPAFAQSANTSATATANIIAPISVSADQNMVFGNILANTGGTVTVSPTDGRTSTGTVALIGGTAPKAAHFSVLADSTGGANYVVSYTKTDLTGGPGPDLVVSAITSDISPTSGNAPLIKVGATITIASGQLAGVYTGAVKATATYQ